MLRFLSYECGVIWGTDIFLSTSENVNTTSSSKVWPSRNAKKAKTNENLDKCLALAISNLTEPPKVPVVAIDCFDRYGQVVADDFKIMEEDQALLARRLISDICFHGRAGKLNVRHKINDSVADHNVFTIL